MAYGWLTVTYYSAPIIQIKYHNQLIFYKIIKTPMLHKSILLNICDQLFVIYKIEHYFMPIFICKM